jgi:hypothetical protein
MSNEVNSHGKGPEKRSESNVLPSAGTSRRSKEVQEASLQGDLIQNLAHKRHTQLPEKLSECAASD